MTFCAPDVDMRIPAPGRDDLFDTLRGLAMLYIVGVWHLSEYIAPPVFQDRSQTTFVIAVISLGVFAFISGAVLTSRYDFSTGSVNTRKFLKGRALRIYPLYAVAVVLIAFVHNQSLQRTVHGLLLISPIVGTFVKTVWFATTICFYYLLFPLLTRYGSPLWPLALLGVLAVGGTWVHFATGWVEPRAIVYLFPFVLGILTGRHRSLRRLLSDWRTALVSLLGLIVIRKMFSPPDSDFNLFNVIYIVLGTSPAMFAGKLVTHAVTRPFFYRLSYISFAMYLFHRPIFAGLLWVVPVVGGWPRTIYLVLVCMPVIAICAYGIQWSYDGWRDRFFGSKESLGLAESGARDARVS